MSMKNEEWELFYKNNTLDSLVKNNLDLLWQKIFSDISLVNIDNLLKKELKTFGSDYEIFPRPSNIFNSFNRCPLDNLKIIIIGQDPYHNFKETINGDLIPEAMGLSFSVPNEVKKNHHH